MDYLIKSFNEKHKNKTYHHLIIDISEEVAYLDRIKKDFYTTKYHQYIGDFLFFLKTGIEPAGIKAEGLKLFLPVINQLTGKGFDFNDDLREKLYS